MQCDKNILLFKNYVEALTGLRLVIAGGYCRDLIHNAKPKDVDMFVLNTDNYRSVGHKLGYKCGLSTEYMAKYGKARGNPDYKGVFKLCVADYFVDIILWNNPATTAEEVVKRFDLNVNQYWVGDDGEIKFFDDAPHITGELKALNHFEPERLRKIQQKLGYNV